MWFIKLKNIIKNENEEILNYLLLQTAVVCDQSYSVKVKGASLNYEFENKPKIIYDM